LAISDISLLELATLASKGRIDLHISLESFLREVEARFVVLPISGRACVLALELPPAYPKDPADRIIGATALAEGLPLVTADREIRRSKALHTIWSETSKSQLLAVPRMREKSGQRSNEQLTPDNGCLAR